MLQHNAFNFENTESYNVGIMIVGEPESYFNVEGRIYDNDATTTTSVPFTAEAATALEGDDIVLTLTADPGVYLEFWKTLHGRPLYRAKRAACRSGETGRAVALGKPVPLAALQRRRRPTPCPLAVATSTGFGGPRQ
jgi:hypothetical protein